MRGKRKTASRICMQSNSYSTEQRLSFSQRRYNIQVESEKESIESVTESVDMEHA